MSTAKEEETLVINMAGNINHEGKWVGGKWVVNLGAIENITCSDSMLENKTKKNYEAPVVIPNGDAIAVKGRGEFTLPNGMKIKDVLHVPEFKCNLLSVSKLTRDLKCAITFFPDFLSCRI
ncbi:hypothetical protein HanRHA438_Chr16g0775951 [Helianthus annuus]|nr:hypothetical protein HanRHA438_Chr16g0775951 [Helianthus annuus]